MTQDFSDHIYHEANEVSVQSPAYTRTLNLHRQVLGKSRPRAAEARFDDRVTNQGWGCPCSQLGQAVKWGQEDETGKPACESLDASDSTNPRVSAQLRSLGEPDHGGPCIVCRAVNLQEGYPYIHSLPTCPRTHRPRSWTVL